MSRLEQQKKLSRKRVINEYKKLLKAKQEVGVMAEPNADNICNWDATMLGPQDTIWEGGTFHLKIHFPPDYPQKPPEVKFVTKMFHPNIYENGSICLDTLQDQWSPAISIPALLTAIRSLLDAPNPDSPANKTASTMFVEDRLQYFRRVRDIVDRSSVHEDNHVS
eukprot:INCI6098.1.p2 GENE.INCI6098.1~~INCI6098.1.p2  ORF type:complete len:165 (+),score=26.33 INCI6098.1:181-675(+)